MMSTFSAILWLWLYLSCQTIVKAEQHQSRHKSLHPDKEKCHMYMSPTQCAGWLHEYVNEQVEALNDTLNEVKEDIQNTDSLLDWIQSNNDEKHRTIVTRMDKTEKQIISVMGECKSDLKVVLLDIDTKHSLMDKTVLELKEAVEKVQANIYPLDGRLNSLSSTLSEKTEGLDTKLDTGLKNLRDDLMQEADKFRNGLTGVKHSISEHKRELDGVNAEVASSKTDLTEKIQNTDVNLNTQVTDLKTMIEEFRTNVVNELGNKIDQVKHDMDKETSTLKRILEQSNKDNHGKFQEFHDQVRELKQTLDRVTSILETKIDGEIKTIKDDLDGQTLQLKDQVQKVEDTMNTELRDLKTELSTLSSDLERHKTEMKIDINNAVENLDNQVKAVNNKVTTVESDLDGDLTVLKNEVEDKIKREANDLFTKIQTVNHAVDKQNSTLNLVYENTFYKDGLIMAIMLLFAFLVLNYFIVYIIVKRTKSAQVSPATTMLRSLNIKEPRSPTEVRNWFASSLPLKNAVCIISFSEQAQTQNKKLIQAVLDKLPASYHDKLLYHVIRKEEDIPNIPLAKLCLMFVEFTERHVIIEEMGLGLGDLKRKTYYYLTESGACLSIIYVRDPESRKIEDKTLYNHGIHCVSAQKELIALRDDQRFISIYEKFTSFQLKRLVELITKNVVK